MIKPKFLFRFALVAILIIIGSLSFLLQPIPTQSQTPGQNTAPLTSAQASSIIASRQTNAIDNALNNVIALPATLFPNCIVTSTSRSTNAANNPNANRLVNCLRDIVNVIFIVAVIWVIINITTSNLGLILRSGEGAGEGPVANARRQIEKALIGLVLIGGISLLLNLFASNLLNINFQPLSQVNIRPFTFSYLPPDPGAPTQQANYFNNRNNGNQRTDITLTSTDTTTKTDSVLVGKWVDNYFRNNGVTSSVPGSSWVFFSRGTSSTANQPQIPLQYLVAYGRVTSNWGAGGANNSNYTCATSKKNMFLTPLSDTERRVDTTLKQKEKDQTVQPCDYIKNFGSWEQSMREFTQYYAITVGKKTDCAIFEALQKNNPSICPAIQKEVNAFVDFIKKQSPPTT